MKHFTKPDGSIWAFEDDGSQDHLITGDMTSITALELAELTKTPLPSKEDRIAAIQEAYDSDREKLNKAWLAALIADGAGEALRQEILKGQMSDLEAQLEIDILTVIMEE